MKHPQSRIARRFSRPLMFLCLAALAACSGPPIRYYSLAETAPPVPVAAPAKPLFIELAPVAVPERLARPQLVVRAKDAPGDAELSILEQRRWASSFENELRDALGAGIASRLGAVDLSAGGRQRGQPVVRIALRVSRFEAVQDSRIDAVFSWTLAQAGESAAVVCRLALTEPVGPGIDELARGAQRMSARLADAIAASVAAQQAGRSPACAA